MTVGVRAPAALTGGRLGKTAARRRCSQGMITTPHRAPACCGADRPPLTVVEWRRCRLEEAGFPAALARRLATGRADVHALLDLVDRGCPPELAAHILEPIDASPAGQGLP